LTSKEFFANFYLYFTPKILKGGRMATGQIWGKLKTILLKNFTIPGSEIVLEAGTELNAVGKSSTKFQRLVFNRLIWILIGLTETK